MCLGNYEKEPLFSALYATSCITTSYFFGLECLPKSKYWLKPEKFRQFCKYYFSHLIVQLVYPNVKQLWHHVQQTLVAWFGFNPEAGSTGPRRIL
jgi:hypothetical protein